MIFVFVLAFGVLGCLVHFAAIGVGELWPRADDDYRRALRLGGVFALLLLAVGVALGASGGALLSSVLR